MDKEKKEKVKETPKVEEVDYKKLAEDNEKLAEDFKDKWYRTTAEYTNYRKRTQLDRSTAYKDGQIDAIKKLLTIGDNLERALSYPLDEKSKEGMELMLKQFKEVMKSLSVEEIDPTGEEFNPATQEAVMQAESENGEKSGTVKTTFLKGYKMGDTIIRYAQVVVVK